MPAGATSRRCAQHAGLAAFAVIACLAGCGRTGDIEIRDAWVLQAPPRARMMAGYLHIANHGAEAATIVAVASPAFGAVEVHRSVLVDERAFMEPAMPLIVGPGDTLELAPGGLHLMLVDPVTALSEGDVVGFTFEFVGGATLSFDAPVRKPAQ